MIVALPFTHRAHWDKAFKRGIKAYEECDFVEAEKQFRAAVIAATKFGLEDPRAVQSLNRLGMIYAAQGKFGDAEKIHVRALSIAGAWLGPNTPQWLKLSTT